MKEIWKKVAWICLAALVCVIAGWQSYQYWANSRRLSKTAKAYQLQASRGDARAEYELSKLYFSGNGVRQNYAEAFRMAHMAADQGYAMAASAIGSWYYHGLGAPKNYGEAFRWYSIAAAKGDAAGQYGLGYMYRRGLGVRQDDKQAVEWIRKSAQQGYPRAETELAFLLRKGYGVPQDNTQAANWYRKAACQGDAEAESGIGFMEWYGYGVEQNRGEATRWFRHAAEQGDAYARHALGIVWLGMTAFQLLVFFAQLSGGLLLLSLLPARWSGTRFRSKIARWAGFLCLLSAGIWWYSSNQFTIPFANGGMIAFTVLKFLLSVGLIPLLLIVLRGERNRVS